jgi:hypothetical protein
MRVSASRLAMVFAAREPNAPFAPVMRTVLPLKDFVVTVSLAFRCFKRFLHGKTSDSINGTPKEMIATMRVAAIIGQ